jgi:hypothetical protein
MFGVRTFGGLVMKLGGALGLGGGDVTADLFEGCDGGGGHIGGWGVAGCDVFSGACLGFCGALGGQA